VLTVLGGYAAELLAAQGAGAPVPQPSPKAERAQGADKTP